MKCLWILSAFLLIGTGCRSVNMAGPAGSRARPTVVEDERLVTDRSLRKKAQVVEIRESRTEGNLLQAQVCVWNTTRSQQRVNYRFEWFDRDGMRVDSILSSWRPRVVHGGEKVWITATAPSPEISNFQFKMVESKR